MKRFAWFGSIVLVAAIATPAGAATLGISVTNNSICHQSNNNNDPNNNDAPYIGNQNVDPCFEAGNLADNNAFQMTDSANASGTTATFVSQFAVAADSALANDEWERGELDYSITLTIAGTGGAAWTLDGSVEIDGLIGVHDNHNGSGTADVSALTVDEVGIGNAATLNIGNLVGSGNSAVIDADALFSTSGTGDQTVTYRFQLDCDAWSESTSIFNSGDEAACLFGVDDVMDFFGFLSSTVGDDYSTWGRSPLNDGIHASWSLNVVPEPTTALLLLVGAAAIGRRRA